MLHFYNESHRQKVMDCLWNKNRIYPDGQADNFYLPTFYILLSPKNDLYKKTQRFIHDESIDFEKMLSTQDFPSSENQLIRLAANLFNGSMEVTPSELIDTLDDENFEIALQAMYFKHNGCHIRDMVPVEEMVDDQEQDDEMEL